MRTLFLNGWSLPKKEATISDVEYFACLGLLGIYYLDVGCVAFLMFLFENSIFICCIKLFILIVADVSSVLSSHF